MYTERQTQTRVILKTAATVSMKYLTIISGQMHLLHQFKDPPPPGLAKNTSWYKVA